MSRLPPVCCVLYVPFFTTFMNVFCSAPTEGKYHKSTLEDPGKVQEPPSIFLRSRCSKAPWHICNHRVMWTHYALPGAKSWYRSGCDGTPSSHPCALIRYTKLFSSGLVSIFISKCEEGRGFKWLEWRGLTSGGSLHFFLRLFSSDFMTSSCQLHQQHH